MLKRKKKNVLSVVLSAVMTIPAFAGMSAFSYATETSTWTGSGTAADPYVISTQAGMEAIDSGLASHNNYAGVYFKIADSVTTLTLDSNYDGIGNPTITSNSSTSSPNVTTGTGFAGIFDGNGKTINISMSKAKSGVGIFDYIAPAGIVENFTVSGSVSVTGSRDAVGAVAGYNAGIINKVTNTASVTASSSYNVGGIAGFNDAHYVTNHVGVIKNSQNAAAVAGKSKTGGIVGENAGKVTSCSNTGAISSTNGRKDGTGGIAGRNGNNNTAVEVGTIVNCYNTGAISDSSGKWTGGIAGFQNSLSSCTNCYNTGTITGYGNRNNIVGLNEGTTTNCYGNQTNGTGNISETGEIKTDTEMVSADFLTDISEDADGLWEAVTGSYPALTYEAADAAATDRPAAAGTAYVNGTLAANGDGTADTPYNNLADAVTKAGAGGTVYVKGTVTFNSAVTRHDSVTIKRASGFTDPLFKVNVPAGSYVTLTSATIDGNDSGTLFNVESGTLRLRGNIKLQKAAIGVYVKNGGVVEVNKSVITTATAINTEAVGSSAAAVVLNDFGGTSITNSINLGANTYISVASALNSDISVEAASSSVVAMGTGSYPLTNTDLGHFQNGEGNSFNLADNQITIS